MATIKKYSVRVIDLVTKEPVRAFVKGGKSKAEVVADVWEELAAEMALSEGELSVEEAAAIAPAKYRIVCDVVRYLSAAGVSVGEDGRVSKSARRRQRRKAAKAGGPTIGGRAVDTSVHVLKAA